MINQIYIDMRNFYLFILVLFSANISAQNTRYLDDVFSSVNTTTLEYSSTYNLDAKVYEPVGDNETNRPLIIFAHGGSFIGGSLNNPTMVDLCESFAKKGYVTASIQYRLGTVVDMLDSLNMIDVVMKALGDAKAAVRYFRMDAANGNTFNIDPNTIFFGGNSAGAIIGCHLGILTDMNEVNSDPYLVNIVNNNGGFEGNSGNSGYSSEVTAIINLAGAINKTSWIGASDKPIVSCHGDLDGTVPYQCGNALGMGTLPVLCGSGSMKPFLDQNNVVNDLLLFPNEDHCPWSTNPTKMNEVIVFVKNFLYQLLNPASISSSKDVFFEVSPNPSSGVFSLSTNEKNLSVVIVNSVGQITKNILCADNCLIDLSSLPSGLYTLVAKGTHETFKKKLILQ